MFLLVKCGVYGSRNKNRYYSKVSRWDLIVWMFYFIKWVDGKKKSLFNKRIIVKERNLLGR